MKRIKLLVVKDEILFSDLNVPVKTKTRAVSYYLDEAIHQLNDTMLLYINSTKTLYLCKITAPIEVTLLNDTHTKINRKTIYGDYSMHSFYSFKVLTQFKLNRKIKFPEEDKTYFLEKPIHSRLLAELLKGSLHNPEIYAYLSNDKNIDSGVLPLKVKDYWGFLYYERQEDGEYEFKFESINNVDGAIKLTQQNEGFKDFTYFIISHSLPKAIKIGRAENPTQRLRQIQAHNARDIEFEVVLADGRLETYYHSKFDYLRINSSREWFEIGEELLEVIQKEKVKINYITGIFNKSEFKKQLFS